jgi:hypothetical protein
MPHASGPLSVPLAAILRRPGLFRFLRRPQLLTRRSALPTVGLRPARSAGPTLPVGGVNRP